jgi:hypothetical protein
LPAGPFHLQQALVQSHWKFSSTTGQLVTEKIVYQVRDDRSGEEFVGLLVGIEIGR